MLHYFTNLKYTVLKIKLYTNLMVWYFLVFKTSTSMIHFSSIFSRSFLIIINLPPRSTCPKTSRNALEDFSNKFHNWNTGQLSCIIGSYVFLEYDIVEIVTVATKE